MVALATGIVMGYLPLVLVGQPHDWREQLSSTKGLTALNGVELKSRVYRGKRCLMVTEKVDPQFGVLAVEFPRKFKDGVIEFDEAGVLTPLHNPTSRGFVGLAFHICDDTEKYECFYLRMTNGRSPSQELRNHTVQYCEVPDHRWNQLRASQPFRYEAYTDVELGAWRHIKIKIKGTEGRFYVGGATQPTLVVHDLFLASTSGKLALWVGGYTRAYFANLQVREG